MPEFTPPFKPSRTYGFLSLAVLAVVALIAVAAAWGAMIAVERSSRSAVERALFLAGEDWAEVETNGLQVILSGTAPSEAARFSALATAGHEVDGARVIDTMVVPEPVAIEPPRFSIEMLRNQGGISLIGLIPAEVDREALAARIRAIDPIKPVADFLETADHPTPDGWDDVVDFVLYTTQMLPRSKISMDAEHVAVEAIAASPAQKAEWERVIRRERPAGLRLALDIRSPHEVVSPFIVRFLSDDKGTRFDACTAYTEAGRNLIVSAGIAAGVKGAVDCTVGLGVPSPDWPDAVARGIRAVRELGGGALTFSDADVTLVAPEGTPQDTFDRVTGELEADLPEVFSLHAVLPVPDTGATAEAGPPEFTASLAADGRVQLRGRVAREQDRTIAESFARARFGTDKVYAPLRLDPGLPGTWAVRTLAGLEALDQLAEGRVVVRPDVVTVTGSTGDKGAAAEISRLLSEKLGEAQDFRVNVSYEEKLDPVAAMPTPQECAADINGVLARNKITFAPGSAEIELASAPTVDRIAEILKTCPDVAMEIGGYTDSQGREEMNQALSQRRAEAVVSALLARRVLTTNLTAFGYGEQFPIADNDTEEGREANRRIEFSLVGETRPHPEVGEDGGDAPSIRPPARPDSLGQADSPDGADAPVQQDDPAPDGVDDTEQAQAADAAGDTAMPPDDTAPDVAMPRDAVEDEPAPPTPAAETAPPAMPEPAAPEPVEPVGAGAEDDGAVPSPASDPAATAAVEAAPAAETAAMAPDTVPEAPAEPDPGAAPEPLTGTAVETGPADAPADDPATGLPAATAEAADTLPSVEPEARDTAADPATDPATDPPADQPADEGAPAPTDTLGEDEMTPDAVPADPAPGPQADGIAPVTAQAEAGGPSDPATDPAAQDEAAEVPGAASVAAATEPTDPALPVDPEITEPAAPTPDAAAAPVGEDLGIPVIRPRARPPLVVHPDLAGIRPKPRPAVVPDVPSTE